MEGFIAKVAGKRRFEMKLKQIILIVLIMVVIGSGCGQDVESLERNLYYDMEELNDYAVKFMKEYLRQINIDHTNLKGNSKLLELKAALGDKVEEGINPPRHLKDETDEWFSAVQELEVVFKEMMEGIENSDGLTPQLVRTLDRRDRIYNGFREYEWR